MKRKRSRRKKLFLGLLCSAIALLLLVLTDIVLSFFFPRLTQPQLLSRDPNCPEAYYLERPNPEPRNNISPSKPDGTYRIFAYGGSSAWGLPFGHHGGFTGWLKMMIDRSSSPAKVEIANLGYVGYCLQDVVDGLEDSIPYEPDCVIIYSGHNEFMLHNLKLRELACQHPAVWASRRFAGRHSAIYRRVGVLVDRIMRLKEGHREFKVDMDKYKKTALPNFKSNLAKIIRICRRNHICLVLATVIANDRDWQPTTTTPMPLGRQRGIARFKEKLENTAPERRNQLIEEEIRAAGKDLRYQFHIARAILDVGHPVKARELLKSVRDRDTWPVRVTSPFNDAIREAARADPGVHLLDVEQYFENLAEHRLIGYQFMLDSCHPTPKSHFAIARELYMIFKDNNAIPGLDDKPLGQNYSYYLARNKGFKVTQYMEIAGYLYGVKLYEKAQYYYLLLLKSVPNHLRAAAWSAVAYMKQGKRQEAIEGILRAYRIASMSTRDANNARRKILSMFGSNKDARDTAEKLISEALSDSISTTQTGPAPTECFRIGFPAPTVPCAGGAMILATERHGPW